MITGGKAAKSVGGCGDAERRLWGTKYGGYSRPWGGGNSYGDPDGESYQTYPLAWAFQTLRWISLVTRIRPNKGLHRTAHKLPRQRGLAMINPVKAAHYCARALYGEP